MCKPNKMGWDHRWPAKELAKLKEFERETTVVYLNNETEK